MSRAHFRTERRASHILLKVSEEAPYELIEKKLAQLPREPNIETLLGDFLQVITLQSPSNYPSITPQLPETLLGDFLQVTSGDI